MRRAILAILGTIAGIVALLSFKTHTSSVADIPVATSTTDPSTSGAGMSAPEASSTSTSTSSSPSSSGSSASTDTKTVTGNVIDTSGDRFRSR